VEFSLVKRKFRLDHRMCRVAESLATEGYNMDNSINCALGHQELQN
jgi:hypothetical protein